MADEINRRVVLARRPEGAPVEDDFGVDEAPVAEPGEGEVLYRAIYLSLDPYMRGRMSDAPSYAAPVAIGGVLEGESVGKVLASNHPDFAPGDIVAGHGGWQSHPLLPGKGLRKVDPSAAPISTALGVLGMPGMTAYAGLHEIGKPKDGETLVVAAASGAVGSAVGQIAKIRGCRAVGIAGGPGKCAFVTGELGFDACVDRRAPDFVERLEAACPDGIDIYFENVGGKVFDAVFPLLNPFARVPICGTIATYNATEPPAGPDGVPALERAVLVKRLTLRGFIVWDFKERVGDFRRDMGAWVRDGKVRYREDIREGIENAPKAMIALLQGGNFGKMLIRVSPDPTR